MATEYSTKALLQRVRMLAAIPSNNPNFTDDKLVMILNDELESTVIPLIMQRKSEYLVHHVDIQLTDEPIQDIDIPHNAIYGKFRDITILNDTQEISLPLLQLESITASRHTQNNLFGYVQQDYTIKIYKGSTSGNSIRVYYYRRPNSLVSPAMAAQIKNITGNVLTISQLPQVWYSFNPMELSVINHQYPFNVKVEVLDVIDLDNPTIEVTSTDNISVGDWVTISGYSVIPQIPPETHPYLVSCAVLRVFQANGDKEGMTLAMGKRDELRDTLITSMADRNDGARAVVLSRYSLARRRF